MDEFRMTYDVRSICFEFSLYSLGLATTIFFFDAFYRKTDNICITVIMTLTKRINYSITMPTAQQLDEKNKKASKLSYQ